MVKSVPPFSKRTNSQDESQDKEKLSVILAFFAWASIIYMFESATFSAAQDILAGTDLQTTTLLVAFDGATFLSYAIGPPLVIVLPYLFSISLAVLSLVSGLLLVVLMVDVAWKIFGVVLLTFGYGYGCVVVLSLTSFFHPQKTASAFSAGSSVGFMISLLYYTGWFV